MTYQLKIECRKQSDVLERVLRVIRHRGFSVEAMDMNLSSCGQQMELSVAVDSSRPIHLLTSQIEKLHDVIHWHSEQSNNTLQASAG